MTSFILKLIACLSMLIDHTGYLFFPDNIILRYIGRISFPIFAFQISEGFIHTKNNKRYLLRLFLLAIISQYPFSLIFQSEKLHLNTIFTLFLGLLSITIYNKNKTLGMVSAIIFTILASIIHFDYGRIGILLIVSYYIFRNKKLYLSLSYIILFSYLYLSYIYKYLIYEPNIMKQLIMYYLPYYLVTLTTLPLILLYNKQQGFKIKWFFYLFYPIHLILLIIIKNFI